MRKLFWGLPTLPGNSHGTKGKFNKETKTETEEINGKVKERNNACDTNWE